ncbi:MAG: TRAP transporter small permease subunit [Woeseiaceae bacterium]|nr:TRAP transporter small permease subunit [Woeseiaceae bacterium]
MSATTALVARLERWGTAAENAVLVMLLGALMLLAVGQIALRIFFSSGFIWADELVKLIVLWIALVASIAAARSDRHLRIDVISHFVPDRFARFPRLLVDAFATFMCGLLAWQSWRYLQLTIEFEETVLVHVPAWLAYGLLPLSFALMCYRFALLTIGHAIRILRPQSDTREAR